MKHGYLLSSNYIHIHDTGYNRNWGDRHACFNIYQAGIQSAEHKIDVS